MFTVAGVLSMAFGQYRRAKRQGTWHWEFLFGLLGATGLFIGLLIVPLSRGSLLETNPNLLLVLVLTSVLLFPAAVVVTARKVSENWVVK